MTTQTMSRRFGVEIEFLSTITREQAVTSLRAAGIRVESSYYTHDTTPYWKIVVDGSCGYELVSPVLEGEAGLEEVRIAAAALEAATTVRNRPVDTGLGMSRTKWFFQTIEAKGLTKFYTARAKKLAA